ncbi:MAG: hypothetical protein R2838_08600 [Caldilineaceae bacterium]
MDYTIFTPGSDAGVSINIMGSLARADFDGNAELIRERISGTVVAAGCWAGGHQVRSHPRHRGDPALQHL